MPLTYERALALVNGCAKVAPTLLPLARRGGATPLAGGRLLAAVGCTEPTTRGIAGGHGHGVGATIATVAKHNSGIRTDGRFRNCHFAPRAPAGRTIKAVVGAGAPGR